MKIQTSRKAAFTLVEIMIVVAIIGLLAAIAVPNFIRARLTVGKNTCINNLRLIDAAKQTWAVETGAAVSAAPDSASLVPYIGRNGATALPACPNGGAYTMGPVNEAATCSLNASGHALPH